MAWPDFSELTFAFAYLRELEALKGTYDDLPDFISQAVEADAGYDAAIAQGGIITFIQFKRSEVMTRSSAKELANAAFATAPVFRMHLHRRNSFGQHLALQGLEAAGYPVLYVTSAAKNRSQLVKQAQSQSILASSVTFLPSEIVLPDLTDDHHVSFGPGAPFKIVYSDQGQRSQRKIDGPDALSSWLEQHRRSGEANRQMLRRFVAECMPKRLRSRKPENLLAQARFIARMRYDLELVFLK